MAIVTGTADNDSLFATPDTDTLTGLGEIDTFIGTAFDLDGDTITDLEDGERIEILDDPVSGFSYAGGVLSVTVDTNNATETISIFIENEPYGYFAEVFGDLFKLEFYEAIQVITVSAVQTALNEDGGGGIAQLILNPDVATEGDTNISLSVTAGTAGTDDYTVLNTSVVIPGMSSDPVTVDIASIIDDALPEDAETFTVSLMPSFQGIALTQDEVSFTIAASDQPVPTVVSVQAVDSILREDDMPGTARIALTPDVAPTSTVVVDLSIIAGTADTADYSVVSTQVTLPADSTAPVIVDVAEIIDDALPEGVESFSVSLSTQQSFVALAQDSVAFQINVSDQTATTVSAVAVDSTLREDGTPGTARVVLTPDVAPSSTILVDLSVVAGTAGTDDYSVVTTQVELPAGSTAPVTVDVADIIDDALPEGAESFSVSLSSQQSFVTLAQETLAFQIDASDQVAPTVVSFVPQDGDGTTTTVIKFPWEEPQTAESVTFAATFSAPVVNVDPSDFTLAFTGSATGRIASLQATGDGTYAIVVDSLSGNGTVGLDVAPGTDIRALAGGPTLEPVEPPTDGVATVSRGPATPAPASVADPFRIIVAEDDTVSLDLDAAVAVVAGVPFQSAYYLYSNQDVAAAVDAGAVPDAAAHFAQFGLAEGRAPNPFYDEAWYLSTYDDVAGAVAEGGLASGLQHYALYGAAEHRAPGPLFDPAAYLSANVDVAEAGADPLLHFLLHGAAEGRDAYLFDA